MGAKNSNGKSYGVGRTRNYSTIVYPDSAPENWKEILSEVCVPGFISPLHDSDVNPTGEPKKPHWHVMILFETVKTKEQAQEIINLINGVGCETIVSVRGMARYLCHLDNPEKTQYSTDDVTCLCGSDYLDAIGLTTDKYKALDEMIEFCDKYNIVAYASLYRYARAHRRDWFRVLSDNGAIAMREYLKSVKWAMDNNCLEIVDPDTGEIIS